MALTETRPQNSEQTVSQVPVDSGVLGTGNHVSIGRAWVISGSLILFVSLVVSTLAAIEHSSLGGFALVSNANEFIQLWSAGRVLFLFGGLLPILIGLGTSIVPLQVGSPALAFSRGAAAAFWTWLLSVGVMSLAYVLNGGPAGGDADFVVLWALGLALATGATIWALVCIVATVLGSRSHGMSLDSVPVSSWGFLVFGVSGLFVLPVTIAELVVGYLDVKYGYLPSADTRTALVGPLNTLTLAPGLFWMSVPAIALGLESVAGQSTSSKGASRGTMVLLALLGLVGFGSDVYAFASRGRGLALDNGLAVVASLALILIILLLAGSAIGAVRSGKLGLSSSFVGGALAILTLLLAAALSGLAQIGPLVGFINTNSGASISLASELALNGTSFHEGLRTLVLGAVAGAAIAGTHHFSKEIWGRPLGAALGLPAISAMLVGSVLWGAGGIVSGFLGQPMLPIVDPSLSGGVEAANLLGAVGAGLTAVGAAAFVLNVLTSLAASRGEGA